MRLLVSVRDLVEAKVAASGGADFIDLKEPAAGALGGLPVERIAEIVNGLRVAGIGKTLSATIGDVADDRRDQILASVAAVGNCAVDYVKVGIDGGAMAIASNELLQALSDSGWPVVPVFIADQGIDAALIDAACRLRFPALMLDTDDKRAGSLLDRIDRSDLRAFISQVRSAGKQAGLAGALRRDEVPMLAELAPDFAGFRSAVCNGDRAGALDAGRVAALADALKKVAKR